MSNLPYPTDDGAPPYPPNPNAQNPYGPPGNLPYPPVGAQPSAPYPPANPAYPQPYGMPAPPGGPGAAPLTQGRFYVPVAEATEDLFRMSVSTGINFKKHQDVQVDVTGNGAEAFSRGQPTFASFR